MLLRPIAGFAIKSNMSLGLHALTKTGFGLLSYSFGIVENKIKNYIIDDIGLLIRY
mgnify:CR=1 FL=1|jgi:hypothetical protein